jgi:hypothetical protein
MVVQIILFIGALYLSQDLQHGHHIMSYNCVSRCFGMNFVMRIIFSSRSCYLLEPGEVSEGVIVGCAAHLKRGTQVVAHGRPIGLAKDQAAVVISQLYAVHAGRFAIWHARDGR